MAEQKQNEETSILVYNEDRLRLKQIAKDEKRMMKDMFTILLDSWEKNKSK